MMWPPDPALLRALVMVVPIMATIALWLARRPSHDEITGMFLATGWQIPPLLILNAAAPALGWWSFEAEGGLWMGVPVDLLIGWAFLWGALPALLPHTIAPIWIGLAAFALDLLVIPLFRPVIDLYDTRWLLGEVLCIAVALMPGLALARWTAERRNLLGRAVLQAIGFGGLILVALPAAIQSASGLSWEPMLQRPTWQTLCGLQVAFVFAGWGISAAQELALRGGGTPLPQDPTRRLVVSGPYAYIANPMQVSVALVLLAEGALLSSAPVAGAALMVIVFSAGLADWSENTSLRERFGAPFESWRKAVWPWWPRWRPWVPFEATIYYAEGCSPCEAVARFLSARKPVGLRLVPAQRHPHRDLSRITYAPGDGSREEEGVAAFARAMEHISLPWGLASSLIRLPLVVDFLQLVVDASGGGPRSVPRTSE
jgi:protein-S-isoprenylcysteine O-methyltransferase Ste14